jgi:trimethylamine:corrinoid methyltransferase-like protein
MIATVMDGSRNFLGQASQEVLEEWAAFVSKLAERNWESWEKGGRRGYAEQAQSEAERLLREHEVEPLAESQSKELDAIMARLNKSWWIMGRQLHGVHRPGAASAVYLVMMQTIAWRL